MEEVFVGDIIGVFNYGMIWLGDVFMEGEMFKFMGILLFVLEFFCCVCLNNLLCFK